MTRILNPNCCYQKEPFPRPAPVSVPETDRALEPGGTSAGHLNKCRALFAALALILAIAPVAWAHKVNVFARVEGNRIIVEGYFGGKARAIDCPVEVLDSKGTKIHEGRTDGNGVYSFEATEVSSVNGDLKIVLQAGMGHQAVYELAAEDLRSSGNKSGTSRASTAAKELKTEAGIDASEIRSVQFQDAAALKKALDEGLDRKIQPILRMLGEQQKLLMEQKLKGPSVTEVIGGIGWIFGLVGVWAYFMSRNRAGKM